MKKAKVVVYWVSYVDAGGQRVLLFTQDEKIASMARKNIENNKFSIDLILSIKGLGLSLVRLLYITIILKDFFFITYNFNFRVLLEVFVWRKLLILA